MFNTDTRSGQSIGGMNGMDVTQNYIIRNSVPTEPVAQHSNTIDLTLSYFTHFTPINLTTEIKMLTREVRTDQLFGGVRLVLDNTSNALPLMELASAKSSVNLDYSAALGSKVSVETEAVPEIYESNDWPMKSTYSLESPPLTAMPTAKVHCSLHSILQGVPLSFFNNGRTATRIWLDPSTVNTSVLEKTPKGSPAKLVYQQLLGIARTEAQEMRAVLMRFQRELEHLFLGPPQPSFPRTRGAVRVKGELPGLWKERAVKGSIVDGELNIQEELAFQIVREPEMREGELILTLTAPPRLVGRTANILLSIEEREILLGIVAIEAGEEGTARIDLEVNLRGVGVSTKDGRLSTNAFQVVVE